MTQPNPPAAQAAEKHTPDIVNEMAKIHSGAPFPSAHTRKKMELALLAYQQWIEDQRIVFCPKDRIEADLSEITRLKGINEKLVEALQRIMKSDDDHLTIHAQDGDDVARMIEYGECREFIRDVLAEAMEG